MGKAQARALRLLTVRSRSEHELRDRLRRAKFADSIVTEVVDWCRRLGYVDDARFAADWIEYRLLHSPSGRRRLQMELRQKGVSPDIIAEKLEQMLPSERERQLCIDVARARSRRYRDLPPDVGYRRLSSFLQRRGFTHDAIRLALRNIDTDSDNE